MTTTYLSFASIAKLHNNNNAVSAIGEMSGRARTFTIDPDVYSVTGSSEVVLYNFSALKDKQPIKLPQALAERQINISDWLYQKATDGVLTSNRFDCLALLKATFTNAVRFISVGEMVSNGDIWMPSVIYGEHIVTTSTDPVVTDNQAFTLWFADAYFQDQYPTAVYLIVHPLPLSDIDSLYELNYQQLGKLLEEQTPDIIVERENELSNNAPYTTRKVLGFKIYDLINTPSYVMAYWRVLVRGNYNEDSVLEQIRNEILANSKYTEAEWGEKAPDIFNPNEMYGIIRFDRLGLYNKTDNTSTYSPILDFETESKYIDEYLAPFMPADHVIKSTQSVPSLYKSMQYTMTAKENNRDGFQKMSDILPDYQLIPSDDSDFGLMSKGTRDYLLGIENLLAAAAVVTEFSIPPVGITTVKRFNKLWVTKKITDVRYLILTKYQMDQDDLITGK